MIPNLSSATGPPDRPGELLSQTLVRLGCRHGSPLPPLTSRVKDGSRSRLAPFCAGRVPISVYVQRRPTSLRSGPSHTYARTHAHAHTHTTPDPTSTHSTTPGVTSNPSFLTPHRSTPTGRCRQRGHDRTPREHPSRASPVLPLLLPFPPSLPDHSKRVLKPEIGFPSPVVLSQKFDSHSPNPRPPRRTNPVRSNPCPTASPPPRSRKPLDRCAPTGLRRSPSYCRSSLGLDVGPRCGPGGVRLLALLHTARRRRGGERPSHPHLPRRKISCQIKLRSWLPAIRLRTRVKG